MSSLRRRTVIGVAALFVATVGALEASPLAPPNSPGTGHQVPGAQAQASQQPQQAPQEPQQPPEGPEQPPQEAAPAPQPIREGDILARADLVTEALRRIERLIEPVASITQIAAELGSREIRIEALRSDLDSVDRTRISGRRVEDMRLPWLELERDLAGWAGTTRTRFDALQREREYLRDTRTQWELTLEPSNSADLAPELASRAESVLARVIDVETRTREQRDVVGAVSDRIATSRESVSASLQRIDAIAGELRGRLLVRDAPSLWESLGSLEARPFATGTVAAVRDWNRGLIDYVRLYPGRVAFIVVWFFVLLWGALRLRRWSRDAAADANVSDLAREMLERPASVALASSLGISMVILTQPTGSALDVIFALAVVPVVRLGALLLESSARRALFTVIVLTLLMRLALLGPAGGPGTRLLSLLVTCFALAAVVRKARTLRLEDPPNGWSRVIPALVVAAGCAFAVALGANLLGWVRLSAMLAEATIVGFFAAFAWVVLVATIAALLPAAISGGLGRLLPSLRREEEVVARVTVRAAAVVAAVLWLRGVLARFQVRGSVMEALGRISASQFSIGELTVDTGGLFGGLVILAATWLFAQLVRFFLREEVVPRLRLRRGSAQSMISLANYSIWGLGIALAASAAGLTGTQLAVVVGALSVGIGFGLQTIVNNFVSGLILIFERPIKVGDTVQTPNLYGRVERIGIRASVIRSFDGAEIIVPNGELIAKEVTNWTGTDELRRAEVVVGVAYGTDPERVLEILLRVSREHPKALAHPEPQAQMIQFGESSLDFRLRCWTPNADWIELSSDLHVAINRELAAADITIPFPQRDLHINRIADGTDAEIPSLRDSVVDSS